LSVEKRRLIVGLLLGAVIAGSLWGFNERRMLAMYAFALSGSGEPPELLPAPEEGPKTRWLDDYSTVELVAPDTWAIGEPRYAQQNYSYLIVGSDRALLFDAGPGVRDIRRAAESLTDRPIIFLPSHFHYDHVGNHISFDEIAVVDLPYIRTRAEGNRLTLLPMEHLGMAEGFDAPTWQVDHWWRPGTSIDLGGRALTIFHTPGHTSDSISLLDAGNRLFFSGDYLYPGDLYGFLPNSEMGDYLATAEYLLTALREDDIGEEGKEVTFLGAHRVTPPGPPTLAFKDLEDLESGLNGIRDGAVEGSSGYPSAFPINDCLTMLAEPRWLQRWD